MHELPAAVVTSMSPSPKGTLSLSSWKGEGFLRLHSYLGNYWQASGSWGMGYYFVQWYRLYKVALAPGNNLPTMSMQGSPSYSLSPKKMLSCDRNEAGWRNEDGGGRRQEASLLLDPFSRFSRTNMENSLEVYALQYGPWVCRGQAALPTHLWNAQIHSLSVPRTVFREHCVSQAQCHLVSNTRV